MPDFLLTLSFPSGSIFPGPSFFGRLLLPRSLRPASNRNRSFGWSRQFLLTAMFRYKLHEERHGDGVKERQEGERERGQGPPFPSLSSSVALRCRQERLMLSSAVAGPGFLHRNATFLVSLLSSPRSRRSSHSFVRFAMPIVRDTGERNAR